jgi:hypothetical protein
MPSLVKLPSSRFLGVTLFGVGIVLSVIACGLLVAHVRTFSLKRDTAVMIGTMLPALKSSVALLQANRQAEQFFAEHALPAREEQASVYVLPDGPVAVRTIRVFSEIALAVKRSGGDLAILTITFDDSPRSADGHKTVGGHLTLRGDASSVARFLAILSYSGDMMVRDVLDDEKSGQFLQQVQATSPMALKRSADFLYLDLMEYAADPNQAENLMLEDVPAASRADLRSLVLRGGLAQVRAAFDGIAQELSSKNIWPLPLTAIASVVQNGDQWSVDLIFYRR